MLVAKTRHGYHTMCTLPFSKETLAPYRLSTLTLIAK